MRAAVDTNILAYAEGVNGLAMQTQAQAAMQLFDTRDLIIPAQALGELFLVLCRRAGLSKADAALAVQRYRLVYDVAYSSEAVWSAAFGMAANQGLQVWDAVILASAWDAGCEILLSEDMQHGFVWNGLTVINPFQLPLHPLLIRTP